MVGIQKGAKGQNVAAFWKLQILFQTGYFQSVCLSLDRSYYIYMYFSVSKYKLTDLSGIWDILDLFQRET